MVYRSNVLERHQWSLTIDLVGDYRSGSVQFLKSIGYEHSCIETADIEMFNVEKMLISQTPRKVKYSNEFICPPDYSGALQDLVVKIETGKDLTTFLSEKVQNSTNKDGLLNDWGIHHLHLTRQFRPNGLARRSIYQVFAYITTETFYMIQIYPHTIDKNNKDLTYCQQEMVEILHKNWPELIERYKLPGVTGVEPTMTDELIVTARNNGVLSLVQVSDGSVYFPIGGGYASDRTSAHALNQGQYWHNTLKRCELTLRDEISHLFRDFESILFRKANRNLVIRFCEAKNNTIYLFEESNGIDIIIDNINTDKCSIYCRISRRLQAEE